MQLPLEETPQNYSNTFFQLQQNCDAIALALAFQFKSGVLFKPESIVPLHCVLVTLWNVIGVHEQNSFWMKQDQEIFLINSPMSLMGVHPHPWGQTGSSLRETGLKHEQHECPLLSTNTAFAQTQCKALHCLLMQAQPVTKESDSVLPEISQH